MSTKSVSSHSINEQEAQINEAINELKLDENSPRPRLCHLKKWPDFQGYGFNLHAEKAKLQQHIGKVDADSPAESAGLKEGDRIIEVNYVNISNENHQQVVKRIRNGLEMDGVLYPDQVVLLVLDPEADEFYKKSNIVVKHDLVNVLKLETSERFVVQNVEEEEDEEEVDEEEEEEEKIPEFRTQRVDKNSDEERNDKRISNCSSQSNESEKVLKSDELEVSCHKENSLHNSNSDLNNNQLSQNTKEPTNNIVKTSTNSTSSLTNSQDRSPLNQSKQSNSSSATSSPIQSQNSTLNRSNNIFPDEIFSYNSVDIKFKQKGIKAVHEMLQKTNPRSIIKRTETMNCYNNTRPLFRNKDTRPPRPPPPTTQSYRSSTLSTVAQPDQLDRYLEMSAAEFKSYLKSKGRNDPRVMTVDMKRKHEIFQNM